MGAFRKKKRGFAPSKRISPSELGGSVSFFLSFPNFANTICQILQPVIMGDEAPPAEAPEYKLSDSLVADFKDAFERIDKEGTGEIPTSELGAVMRMLGHQLKPDQLQECIEEVDGDGSGFVDFDEFLVLMTKKTKEAEEEKEVREAFRILDKEGKGTIDANVLKEILLALDETMTEADVDEMVDEIDEDGSGAVDYEEFKAVMMG